MFTKKQIKDQLVLHIRVKILLLLMICLFGVTFTHNVSFTKRKSHLLEQSRKVMYSVLS